MIINSKNTVVGSRNVPAGDLSANAVAVLSQTKQQDGTYIITLPINTSDEVMTNLQTGETLTDRLISLNNRSMGLLRDLSTLVLNLSATLGSNLSTMNHIYREDFATQDNLLIQNGKFSSGAITGDGVLGIKFQLNQGIVCNQKPILVGIHDIKTLNIDTENINVYVTANALDTEPFWFNCTDDYINGFDINIPVDYKKEQGKPWCINVKFQFNGTEEMSISDLVIAHI